VAKPLLAQKSSRILNLPAATERAGSDTEMRLVTWITVALLGAQQLSADSNHWNRIRYRGGTVQAKSNPFDWDTSLTVKPDALVLVFAYKQTLRIDPAKVTALSYGQEAHRRVADMVALSLIVTPLALFGLLHESKNHLIGIQWYDDQGKPAGILLEADKNDYRAILRALKTATGKPVEFEP
jgi:hypothetical protein